MEKQDSQTIKFSSLNDKLLQFSFRHIQALSIQTIGIILWEIDRQLFWFSMTVFLFSFNHNGIQLIWGKLRSMWSLRPLRSMRFQRLEAEFRKTRNWIDHVSREV